MTAPEEPVTGALTEDERAAVERVRQYVEAVPTLYDDENEMPEGLILDSTALYDGLRRQSEHDLTLADLSALLAVAARFELSAQCAGEAAVLALLDQHRLMLSPTDAVQPSPPECACGWVPSGLDAAADHRRHLAAALSKGTAARDEAVVKAEPPCRSFWHGARGHECIPAAALSEQPTPEGGER